LKEKDLLAKEKKKAKEESAKQEMYNANCGIGHVTELLDG